MNNILQFVVLLTCISHVFGYKILLIVIVPLKQDLEEDIPKKPDNVIISNWLPQSSVLDHSNLKAFVTHGGFLSITEATSTGVPLVVIPIYGDRHYNAAAVEEKGQGVILDFGNFTKDSLAWALGEVLNNSKYTQSANKIQEIFLDRPMNPKESINHYSELVIRAGAARHTSHEEPSFAWHPLMVAISIILLLFLFLVSSCWVYPSLLGFAVYLVLYLCKHTLYGIINLLRGRKIEVKTSLKDEFFKKNYKK